mgnify:CR=1 FL=1
MQIALIGLGRMGQNMAKRLLKDGHELLVCDPSIEAQEAVAKLGAKVTNISELGNLLKPPRVAWMMVPHDVVNNIVPQLSGQFSAGDIIIDGGNSHFIDSVNRAEELALSGIEFLDVGVSGGIFGLERGYCLMVGGSKSAFDHVSSVFSSLAPKKDSVAPTRARNHHTTAEEGYFHCGKSGAGHYVKMIHNAMEYGMMQSMAESLELLKNAGDQSIVEAHRYDFDLKEICELWRRGSVVSSWLLDLMSEALHKDEKLESFLGSVPDSGEGRWALLEAIKQSTPVPNLANSLFTRFRSRQNNPFAEKSLSALRKEFGGHSEQ